MECKLDRQGYDRVGQKRYLWTKWNVNDDELLFELSSVKCYLWTKWNVNKIVPIDMVQANNVISELSGM